MKKHLKHLGSTIAIIFGVLTILTGFAGPIPNASKIGDKAITGAIIILGALAYRSAKKRKLGECKNTKKRLSLEIGKIIVIM